MHSRAVLSSLLVFLGGCSAAPPLTPLPKSGALGNGKFVDESGAALTLPDGRKRQIVREVFPEYPIAERAKGVVGVVQVRARIKVDGTVVPISVDSAPDIGLGRAAAIAVSQWKFAPEKDPGAKDMIVVFPIGFGFDK